MAWIELHDTLPDHDKVLQVADELKMDKDLVVGKLVRLWTWAINNREDGRFKKRDADTISEIMRFKGKTDRLISALVNARLIDKLDDGYVIHDWDERVGMLMSKREASRTQARERKRRQRDRERELATVVTNKKEESHASVTRDITGTSHASHAVTVPKPNISTNVDITPPTPSKVKKPEFDLEARLKDFSPPMQGALRDWLSYKAEKRQGYKPTGLKSFLSEAENNVRKYGEATVVNSIRMSMAANYQGVVWDKATQGKPQARSNAQQASNWNYTQHDYTEADFRSILVPLGNDCS